MSYFAHKTCEFAAYVTANNKAQHDLTAVSSAPKINVAHYSRTTFLIVNGNSPAVNESENICGYMRENFRLERTVLNRNDPVASRRIESAHSLSVLQSQRILSLIAVTGSFKRSLKLFKLRGQTTYSPECVLNDSGLSTALSLVGYVTIHAAAAL